MFTLSQPLGPTSLPNRVSCGCETKRGNDYFVALADARSHESHMECRSSGVNCNTVSTSHVFGEFVLKSFYLRALGQHARSQYPVDRLALFVSDNWLCSKNHTLKIPPPTRKKYDHKANQVYLVDQRIKGVPGSIQRGLCYMMRRSNLMNPPTCLDV